MSIEHITTLGYPEFDLIATLGYGPTEPTPPGPSETIEADLFKFVNELDQAVYISLFSDRRIPFTEEPPSEPNDRRGWWGDLLEGTNVFIGSRLWTLRRRKMIEPGITDDAETYIREALQWILDDGVATEIDITITVLDIDSLKFEIIIIKGDKYLTKFEAVWNRLEAGEF